MGKTNSKESLKKECQTEASTPKSDLLEESFRPEVEWTEEYLNQLIEEIQSDIEVTPSALLLGPIGAGKSTYINSILSIDRGFITQKAYACGSVNDSTTTEFKKYRGRKLLRNFRLCDTMGVQPEEVKGLNIQDVVNLIEGHCAVKYRFNPISSLQENDRNYKKEVTDKDKCQCVIFVLDSQTMYDSDNLSTELKAKIEKLCEEIKRLDVPRLMILTKIDDLSLDVRNEFSNTFKCRKVYNAVKAASELFGMPLANVHPVKNFYQELEVDKLKCIPLLLPIRQMIQFTTLKFEPDDYE